VLCISQLQDINKVTVMLFWINDYSWLAHALVLTAEIVVSILIS